MSKKYLVVAAALVVAAITAAWGFRAYSESQYYKLIRSEESAARSFFNDSEAFGSSSETLGIDANAASDSSTSSANAESDLAKAQSALDTDQAALLASPKELSNWAAADDNTNKRIKSLWISASQRKTILAINSQELSMISAFRSMDNTAEDMEPTMLQLLSVMKAGVMLTQFSNNYSTQSDIQSNFGQLLPLASFATAGYTYPGESTVKANLPTIDANVVEADQAVGDTYVMYQDLANNELLAALALAPQVQNEANRLGNSAAIYNGQGKKYNAPLDKSIVLAVGSLQTTVSVSKDKKLISEIGLHKYEAASVVAAMDLYSYDHQDASQDQVYPAGSYAQAIGQLKSDKYLAANFQIDNSFIYSITDSDRNYGLRYIDDLTHQHANTGA